MGVYYDGPTCSPSSSSASTARSSTTTVDPSTYDVLVVDDTSGLDIDALRAWVDDGGSYVANGPYGIVTASST